MLGLKRGTVKLVPYHKRWTAAFEREKKRLLARAGGLIVEVRHIGSTAVPGMHAKPIIDMAAGVRNMKDAKKLIKPLAKMGYNFYKKFGQQILFAKGPDAKRTHYLHVMKWNGAKWKNDHLFREFLVSHPARAKAYAALKKKLAKRYPDDRERYTSGKKPFIKATLKLAAKGQLMKMLQLIKKKPGIRPSELNRLLNREHSANLRNALIKRGLVRKERKGTAAYYYPARRVKK